METLVASSATSGSTGVVIRESARYWLGILRLLTFSLSFSFSVIVCAHRPPAQHPGNISPMKRNKQRTLPLRLWLLGHRGNPYPTKTEQEKPALQAGMTPKQVSTWLADTRRKITNIGLHAWSKGKFPDADFQVRSQRAGAASK